MGERRMAHLVCATVQEHCRERRPVARVTRCHKTDHGVGFQHGVNLGLDLNLFNQQGCVTADDYTESAFGVFNADVGRILAYQNPFTLRIGARLEF